MPGGHNKSFVPNGTKIRDLEVISSKIKNQTMIYTCKCICGKIVNLNYTYLSGKSGIYIKCNHNRIQKNIGKIIDDFKIINTFSIGKKTIAECVCINCGFERTSRLDSILRGYPVICYSKICKKSRLNNKVKTDKRCNSKLKLWRQLIIERDITCQICHTNLNLEAHHLDSWHWNIKDRHNIENGSLLCTSCHDLFHTKYGIKNNTKAQFIEFQQIYRLH